MARLLTHVLHDSNISTNRNIAHARCYSLLLKDFILAAASAEIGHVVSGCSMSFFHFTTTSGIKKCTDIYILFLKLGFLLMRVEIMRFNGAFSTYAHWTA